MDVFDAIQARRAVKHYDPNHTMTDDEVRRLMSLAMLAPTAFNIQNWRFVIVKDPELRQQIREVSWGQTQVTDASLLVILCADLLAWEKNPRRYWANTPEPAQDFIVPAIDAYYRGRNQVQRDEAMRSCGIAAQTLMLAAKAMGYDSCPMDGFDYDAVGKLIDLPADHAVSMFVVIGKRAQDPWPRPTQIALEEAVVINRFE